MIRPSALVRMLLPGILVTVLLAGCGLQQTEVGGAVVTLQERARTVRQLATEQNPSAALNEVEALANDLATAAANGDLSAEQHRRAEAALEAVRTDLESLVDEAATADGPATEEPLGPTETSSDAGSGDEWTDDRGWDREDTQDEDSWDDEDWHDEDDWDDD
ncbi:hypothetical protein [Arthrobacter mobilis]|uniref:Uncharacterized protein n=1 Tax=Arthrobacter mobilis TaxID=2724944 RepID=A0A7X6QM55_9MICC|nr:hypothetical protein [Arthrobacter mobilis]NKX56446.1 hypothetical protein [Arthrobacter mobilis]